MVLHRPEQVDRYMVFFPQHKPGCGDLNPLLGTDSSLFWGGVGVGGQMMIPE